MTTASSEAPRRYRISVDIGGTFVDAVCFDNVTGSVSISKAATTPEDPSIGVLRAVEGLGVALADVGTFVHGTTLGLNAVLTRTGVPTGLITNAGFRDMLELGRGDVPPGHMYDFAYTRPAPLVRRRHCLTVPARSDKDGDILVELDEAAVVQAGERLLADNIQSVAICFLHAYRNPEQERRAAALLREHCPGLSVTPSSDVTRTYREYERAATTVIAATIRPIFDRYINRLSAALAGQGFAGQFLIMQSGGGAMTGEAARQAPLTTILSGPAGGISGAAALGERLERRRVLTLDYGGTSLDASVIDDYAPLLAHETRLADVPVLLPVFDIRCIGAGGGSIASVEDGLLQVGPRSAGSTPGPMAYGRGGTEPTTTDAAIVLGFLQPSTFLGGKFSLDTSASRDGVQSRLAGPLGMPIEDAAAGVFDVLIARTIGAVREITVERGRDPAEYSVLAFGGAGPMIAPILAREMDLAEMVVPRLPGGFSSWGMLMADLVFEVARTDPSLLADGTWTALVDELAAESEAGLRAQGWDGPIETSVLLECRYAGQEHTLPIVVPGGTTPAEARAAFDRLHEARYDFRFDLPVQVVTARVRAIGRLNHPEPARLERRGADPLDAVASRRAFCFAKRTMMEFTVYDRARLLDGDELPGPAIVEEGTCTTVIHSDQVIVVDVLGNLLVRRKAA